MWAENAVCNYGMTMDSLGNKRSDVMHVETIRWLHTLRFWTPGDAFGLISDGFWWSLQSVDIYFVLYIKIIISKIKSLATVSWKYLTYVRVSTAATEDISMCVTAQAFTKDWEINQ